MLQVLPPEVISMILAKLDKPDLFNCRLVSQSWNQECTFLLRRSDGYMNLNESNIEEFILFVDRCIFQMPLLPIRLDFNIERECESIKNSLTSFGRHVDTLNSLFGVGIVEKLILRRTRGYHEIKYEAVTNFLAQISVGIGYLDISQVSLSSPIEPTPKLLLTKLKKLVCRGFTEADPKVFRLCPNLESLKLNGYFTNPSQNLLQTITTLDIECSDNPAKLLQDIKSSPSIPQIRNLRLGYHTCSDSILQAILEILANSLKSLTLKPIVRHRLFAFPKLPYLKHFKLECWDRNRIFENTSKFFSLDNGKLPCLTSVEFPLGWTFVPQLPLHSGMIFSSVTSLTIRRNQCDQTMIYSAQCLRETPCHRSCIPDKILYSKLSPMLDFFPNATSVVVVDSCFAYDEPHVKYWFGLEGNGANYNIDMVEILDCDVSCVEATLKQLKREQAHCRVVLGRFPRNSTHQNKIRSLIDGFMRAQRQHQNGGTRTSSSLLAKVDLYQNLGFQLADITSY